MPGMNGFETTERIRTFNSKITIIALSAISNNMMKIVLGTRDLTDS